MIKIPILVKNFCIKNKKIIYFIVGLVLFSGISFSIFYSMKIWLNEDKIGFITDIHAGANKRRTTPEQDGYENTIYPKKYKEYFIAALKKLKKQGIRTVIVTGDNTNMTEFHHAAELKKIEKESGLKVIWVRGNHDVLLDPPKDIMPELGVTEYFYTYDTKKIRIIVLDIQPDNPVITNENLDWIKEKLAETKLPVIVASHAPILDIEHGSSSFISGYEDLGNIIQSSKKVKYVISGHVHKDKEMIKDGVTYKIGIPLTQKNHMGSFYIIDMEKNEIKHYENYYEE